MTMKVTIKTSPTTSVEVDRPYLQETDFFGAMYELEKQGIDSNTLVDFTTLDIGEYEVDGKLIKTKVTYDDVKLLIQELETPGSVDFSDTTPGYDELVKFIGNMTVKLTKTLIYGRTCTGRTTLAKKLISKFKDSDLCVFSDYGVDEYSKCNKFKLYTSVNAENLLKYQRRHRIIVFDNFIDDRIIRTFLRNGRTCNMSIIYISGACERIEPSIGCNITHLYVLGQPMPAYLERYMYDYCECVDRFVD